MEQKELYKSYKDCASFVPESLKMNINDLVNTYIQKKGTIEADSYFSAIVLHYWPKINRMYQKSIPYATFEDAYDWMTSSILYSIDYAPWLNPDDKLYTDPNAPDKVINRIVICERANWFQAQNRFTRKINMNVLSTDAFQDENGFEPDQWQPIVQTSVSDDNPLYDPVRKLFHSLNYEKAFVLDMIVFDDCKDEKELVNTFKDQLNDVYLEQFSHRYDLGQDQVNKAASYMKEKTTAELKARVQDRLKEIRTTMDIKEMLNV